MSLIDYIEDYYFPMMEISKDIPECKNLLSAIQSGNKKDVKESYIKLVEYIKLNIHQYEKVNMFFNRMRTDIVSAFDLVELNYIFFKDKLNMNGLNIN